MFSMKLLLFIILSISGFANEGITPRPLGGVDRCSPSTLPRPSDDVTKLSEEVRSKLSYICMEEEVLDKRCECFRSLDFTSSDLDHSELSSSLRGQYLISQLRESLNKLNEKWFFTKKLYSINDLEIPRCNISDDKIDLLREMDSDRGELLRGWKYRNPFARNISFRDNLRTLSGDDRLYKSKVSSEMFNAFASRLLLLSLKDNEIDVELLDKNYNKLIDEYVSSHIGLSKSKRIRQRLREDTYDLLKLVSKTINEASVLTDLAPSSYNDFKKLVVGTMNAYLTTMYESYEKTCESVNKEIDQLIISSSKPVYSLKGVHFHSFIDSLRLEDPVIESRNRPDLSVLYCEALSEYIPEVYENYMSAAKDLFSYNNEINVNYDGEKVRLNILNPMSSDEGRGVVTTSRGELLMGEESYPVEFVFTEELEIRRLSATYPIEQRVAREVSLNNDYSERQLALEENERRQNQRMVEDEARRKREYFERELRERNQQLVLSGDGESRVRSYESAQVPRGEIKLTSIAPSSVKVAQRKILDHVSSIVNKASSKKIVDIVEIEAGNSEVSDVESVSSVEDIKKNLKENKYSSGKNKVLSLHNYFTNPQATSLASFYKYDYKYKRRNKGKEKVAKDTPKINKGLARVIADSKRDLINRVKKRNKRIPDSIKKYEKFNQSNKLEESGSLPSHNVDEDIVSENQDLFNYFRPIALPDGKIFQRKALKVKSPLNVIAKSKKESERLGHHTSSVGKGNAKDTSSSSQSPSVSGIISTSSNQVSSDSSNIGILGTVSISTIDKKRERLFLLEREFKVIDDGTLSTYKTSDDRVYVFITREVHNIPIHYLQTYDLSMRDGEYVKELISTESLYRVEMNNDKLRVINQFFDLKKTSGFL